MYIIEQQARVLAALFQASTHMQIGSDLRLYVSDSNGNKSALKSWFMKIEDLNELIEDSKQLIEPQNKEISGIRIYPALQNKDANGDPVPEYHTLLIVCTTFDTVTKNHENILLGKVQEYLEPCPSQCPSPNTDLH